MMNRIEMLQVLQRHITDELVVSSYSTATDWIAVEDRVLNYYWHGAMGLCSAHGLGLALGFPKRRVVVLEGDGSLLMNLGNPGHDRCRGAAELHDAGAAERQLRGERRPPDPEPGGDRLHGLARSAGIRSCQDITELADFERKVPELLTATGPVYATLEIEQGPLGPRSYSEMYREERRKAFKEALRAG